jgi:hypothetical protein
MPYPVNRALSTARDTIGINVVTIIWKGLIAAHAAEATAMTYYVYSRGASLATTVSTSFLVF